MPSDFVVIQADWQQYKTALSDVRRRVFIEEQKVPEQLEWDEFDESSLHILAMSAQNQPIGTGRLKRDGQIGRMAVLPEYRRHSVGSAILQALIDAAIAGNLPEVYLHAQLSAIDFYLKHGFHSYGEQFLDANIPHISMRRKLP